MESAMVLSFFIFTPICYSSPYRARQMTQYPRQIKRTLPIGNPSPFFINIYGETSA